MILFVEVVADGKVKHYLNTDCQRIQAIRNIRCSPKLRGYNHQRQNPYKKQTWITMQNPAFQCLELVKNCGSVNGVFHRPRILTTKDW